jgi:hypothetical protein
MDKGRHLYVFPDDIVLDQFPGWEFGYVHDDGADSDDSDDFVDRFGTFGFDDFDFDDFDVDYDDYW